MELIQTFLSEKTIDYQCLNIGDFQAYLTLMMMDRDLNRIEDDEYSELMYNVIQYYQNNRNVKLEYIKNFNIFNDISSKISRKKWGTKICICCYPASALGKWDPNTIESGIPGSEEAVIYVSKVLAKLGYDVTVEASPSDTSIWTNSHSNPRFTSQSKDGYDILIAWRRFDFDNLRSKAKKIYGWAHDIPVFPNGFKIENIDGMFLLSNYHQQLFKKYLFVPHAICGNGVVLDDFKDPMNFDNPYSCGYYSNYGRGLDIVLNIWQDIKIRYPQATLKIYYGRNTYGTLRDDQLRSITDKISELSDLDVFEKGCIGHKELAKEMCNTSIWLYPCNNYSETFCITAVKTQLAGMIPITTKLGALSETVCEDAYTMDSVFDMESVEKYKNLVMQVMRDINFDHIKEKRLKCIEFASKYSWENCIDVWTKTFNRINEVEEIKEVKEVAPPKQPVIIKMNENSENTRDLLISIFCHNDSESLEMCLECISKLNFPKEKILFYFRCYDSQDNTEQILMKWITENNVHYKNICLDTNQLTDNVASMMEAKNNSIKWAIENECDYFYLTPNCFLRPDVINHLYDADFPIIAPLLRVKNALYSNFNFEVNPNGYFSDDSGLYTRILNQEIKVSLMFK